MRYFVIKDSEPVALVCHDYRNGTYICRSVRESFLRIFDAKASHAGLKYIKAAGVLQAVDYSSYEYEWIDDVLKAVLACNPEWSIDVSGESSSSELTVDDLVDEYLG